MIEERLMWHGILWLALTVFALMVATFVLYINPIF